MKNRKRTCEYLNSRNEELRKACRAFMMKEGGTVTEMFEAVAKVPVKRFYISEERALRLLRHKRRTGRWPDDMIPSRRVMMGVIEKRFNELRALRPEESMEQIIFEVVNSPAPGFFLTPQSIRAIFYSSRKAAVYGKDYLFA